MKRLLITGGLGFLGSHTIISLLEKDFEIHILDSLVNSKKKVIEKLAYIACGQNPNYKLNFYLGDVRDPVILQQIFGGLQSQGKPIDAVIHFAGLKSIKESLLDTSKYWDVNFSGTKNLIKFMQNYNCNTFIFSSSATVYGNIFDYSLINENYKLNPVHPYGETKLAVENFLRSSFRCELLDWRIAILRYFNPIGAHPSGLIGEDIDGIKNNIFPNILKVASGQLEYVEIFGNDWDTKDGTPIRDYIHVMDLVEGHISALNYLSKFKKKLINLNIGTGKGTSVLELINIFAETNKIKIPYKITKRRKGDVPFLVADNSLALSTLNWLPQRDISDMCKDGWSFLKKN